MTEAEPPGEEGGGKWREDGREERRGEEGWEGEECRGGEEREGRGKADRKMTERWR